MTSREKAEALFSLYTGITDFESKHEVIIEQLTIYIENQEHTGLSSININGISESYIDDMPMYLRRALNKCIKNVRFF